MPSTVPVLFTVLALVVPGFLIHSVMSMFTTRHAARAEASWVYPLTIGAANAAVWSWLIYLLLTAPVFQEQVWAATLGWTFVILLGPTFIGLLLGYNVQKAWTRRLLFAIGLKPVHPIPTAWDGRFGSVQQAHWVLVTLAGGEHIGGLFGQWSWASTDPNERDLYLEQIYEIDDDGTWQTVCHEKGVLIRDREIRYLEIWPHREGFEP
jgi:hypothetical protein